MSKMVCLSAAIVVFAPIFAALLWQAAQIVA